MKLENVNIFINDDGTFTIAAPELVDQYTVGQAASGRYFVDLEFAGDRWLGYQTMEDVLLAIVKHQEGR